MDSKALEALVTGSIRTNGNGDITGASLQEVLLAVVAGGRTFDAGTFGTSDEMEAAVKAEAVRVPSDAVAGLPENETIYATYSSEAEGLRKYTFWTMTTESGTYLYRMTPSTGAVHMCATYDGGSTWAEWEAVSGASSSPVLDLGELSGVSAFTEALGTAAVLRSGKSVIVGKSTTSAGYEATYLCLQSVNVNEGTARQYVLANNASSTDAVNGWRVRYVQGVKSGSYTLGSWQRAMPQKFWLDGQSLSVGEYAEAGSGQGGVANVDLSGLYGEATVSSAGLMSAADKAKLDGLPVDGDGSAGDFTDFSVSQGSVSVRLSATIGDTTQSATIFGATSSGAGVMRAADKENLDAVVEKAAELEEEVELRQSLPAVLKCHSADSEDQITMPDGESATFFDTVEEASTDGNYGNLFTPTGIMYFSTLNDNADTVYGQHRFFLVGKRDVALSAGGSTVYNVAVKTWADEAMAGYPGSWAYNEDEADAYCHARRGVLFEQADGMMYYRGYTDGAHLVQCGLNALWSRVSSLEREATSESAGLMSAADKAKLDGLSEEVGELTGTTVPQLATELLSVRNGLEQFRAQVDVPQGFRVVQVRTSEKIMEGVYDGGGEFAVDGIPSDLTLDVPTLVSLTFAGSGGDQDYPTVNFMLTGVWHEDVDTSAEVLFASGLGTYGDGLYYFKVSSGGACYMKKLQEGLLD